MKENQLLINKEMRERVAERVEVLDKVKKLILLSNTEYATTEMVANYYEVGTEAIQSLIKDNREELISNGFRLYKRSEILNVLKGQLEITIPNRGMNLFTKRAILDVGMLLRDSKIAREVRTQLLNGFDNAEEENRLDLFTKDIDEEMRLNIELAQAFASGDTTKMLIASQNLNNFKNRKIKELTDENGRLRIFLGEAEIFTKSSLANKLDTNTSTMSKVLKEEKIYTKTCKVSEEFKSKFPNVKIIQETKSRYFDKEGREQTKTDWQWSREGAFITIKYLLERGRVVETENNQYKLYKN